MFGEKSALVVEIFECSFPNIGQPAITFLGHTEYKLNSNDELRRGTGQIEHVFVHFKPSKSVPSNNVECLFSSVCPSLLVCESR